jgi:hypothetical protein
MVKIICYIVILLISLKSFSREEIFIDKARGIDFSSKFSRYPKIEIEKDEQFEILNIRGGRITNLNSFRKNNTGIYDNKRPFDVTEFFFKDEEYNLKKIIIFKSNIEYRDYLFVDKNNFSYLSKKIKKNIKLNLENIIKKLNFLNYMSNKFLDFDSVIPPLKSNIIFSNYIVLRTENFSYILDLAEREEIIKYNYNLKETDLKEVNELIEYIYNDQEVTFKNLDKKIQQRLKNVDTFNIEKLIEKEIIDLFDLLEEKEKMAKIVECNNSSECKEF